jgi:alkylation response protein AidB-like acyl-CoA dehydrogenase
MRPLIELRPKTIAGARLVACAESLADQMSVTATEHDTTGTYPHANAALLRQAGYFVAPIPEQFGGQGVDSVFDTLVASTRLARGDASTTLGLNMHLQVVMSMVRRWQIAAYRGDQRHQAVFGSALERIVDDGVIFAAAISEPNQHLTMPGTRATRTTDGWSLNGRKIFCTMSPAATRLLVSTTYESHDGTSLYGYAEVPTDTPGVTVHDDWDALGMRASGSNSVSLRDVQLPESAVRGGFPVEDAIGYIQRNVPNGLFMPRQR